MPVAVDVEDAVERRHAPVEPSVRARGDQQRDRRGRVWTVTAGPFQEHGLDHVTLRSGDLLRRVNERFADDYMVTGGDAPA